MTDHEASDEGVGGQGTTRTSLEARMDDRRAIGPPQLRVLLQMLHYPASYTQRIVERLSFLTPSGQCWERHIQVAVPEDLSAPPSDEAPEDEFIVSLGMFKRRRFADFEVRDSRGRRLNLVTRQQHGHCLTTALILKYLEDPQVTALGDLAHDEAWSALYAAIYAMFTSVQTDPTGPDGTAREAGRAFAALLHSVGVSPNEARSAVPRFVTEFEALQGVTQYLCWVTACPGEVVNLTATYTISDAPRLARRMVTPARLAAEATVSGTADSATGAPAEPAPRSGLAKHREQWRIERMALYTRCGLGPVHYEVRTPAHDHAGSYYVVVEPPEETDVLYFDWGLGNTIESELHEVDCAHPSAHVHNGTGLADLEASPGDVRQVAGDRRSSIPGSRLHLFLRGAPRENWPIVVGALLNVLLAWLAQRGDFLLDPGSISATLLLAPTVLLAYISQERRRYYAHVTEWLRMLLLAYLLLNVVFVASVRYDLLDGDDFFGRDNVADDAVSGIMFLTSALLAAWFLAIYLSRWTIERQFRRNVHSGTPSWSVAAVTRLGVWLGALPHGGRLIARLGPVTTRLRSSGRGVLGRPTRGAAVDVFAYLGMGYGDRVVRRLLVLALVTIGLMVHFSWGGGRQSVFERQKKERNARTAAWGAEAGRSMLTAEAASRPVVVAIALR